VPHAFKGAIVYQLPFGRGRTFLKNGGVLDAIVGWVAGVDHFRYSVRHSVHAAGVREQWLKLACRELVPEHRRQSGRFRSNDRPVVQPCGLRSACGQYLRQCRQDILRGPGLTDFDFSMAKSFTFPKFERMNLQLRMDASNILNHPSFNNPNNSIGNPAAGQITSTTVGGRNIQLGARLSF